MATNQSELAGVAGRYASALYELAVEQGKVGEIESDLLTFAGAYKASEDLVRMVRSPVIAAADQARAIEAVLTKLGAKPLSINFFKVLARNRRLFAAPDMVRAYQALAAAGRGEVAAEVQSAMPLSEAQLAELKKVLKEAVGKDVTLASTVDPSLLGGLVVKLGSRMIDSSLRTKLSGLKVALKSTA